MLTRCLWRAAGACGVLPASDPAPQGLCKVELGERSRTKAEIARLSREAEGSDVSELVQNEAVITNFL